MRKIAVIASLVAVVGSFGASHAAAQAIVSGPGAEITGAYDTPTSVAATAGEVTYVNLDPLGAHNVVSDAKKVPSCTSRCEPLFKSGNPVPVGTSQSIVIAGIAPGDYTFKCSAHGNMKGTLKIVA